MSLRRDDDIHRLFNRERPIDVLRVDDGEEDAGIVAEVRGPLAFALLIGIASGAYSSFFIASPLLVKLKIREPEFARRPGTEELPSVFLRSAVVPATPAVVTAGGPQPDGFSNDHADDRAAARRRRQNRKR